jgi:hypothetical protein
MLVASLLGWTSLSFADGPTNVTATVITNPPEGGTVIGAGIFPVPNFQAVDITANPGWYIKSFAFQGMSSIDPMLDWQKALTIIALNGGDRMGLTHINLSIRPIADSTVTVGFEWAGPVPKQSSKTIGALTGSSITLDGTMTGRGGMTYQWTKDGNPLPGRTNATLDLPALRIQDNGTYGVLATNFAASTNWTAAIVKVSDFRITINGRDAVDSSYTVTNTPYIGIDSIFGTSRIFYTTDGSTPDFNSTRYQGSFGFPKTGTLRAAAYSSDLTQVIYSDPISITILYFYPLTVDRYGPGVVRFDPPGGYYREGTEVSLIATPLPGAGLVHVWRDGVDVAAPTNTFVMNRSYYVTVWFGSSVETKVIGNGHVVIKPALPFFPPGSTAQLFAIPDPGSYFALWGGQATGAGSPTTVDFDGTSPGTVSATALFSSLATNEATLTVLTDGPGAVTIANPANKYPVGTEVLMHAQPIPNHEFLGWTGDATGSTYDFRVTLDRSKTLTAHFSKVGNLSISNPGYGRLLLTNTAGTTFFRIETSTNLTDWTTFVNYTNYGYPYWTKDISLTDDAIRVFRAVVP